MNRFVTRAMIAGLIFGATFGGMRIRRAAADGAEHVPLEAEKALQGALEKSDKVAAGKLLDANFVWTDVNGKAHKQPDVVSNLKAYAEDNQGESDVQTHFYGQVETVAGEHHGARFLRVWVKRPAGWREFLALDTAMPSKAATFGGQRSAGQGDCENPCRTVPYKPVTAMDKAILAEWQKTKMEEWKPDAADWPNHIADEFLIINSTSVRNKADRVVIAQQQQKAGMGTPGDPITAMEIHDFGDRSAVMISHHTPYRGGKPYYNVRVWTLRDGRWQLAISQQTTIQSATALTATVAK
ncbi:MAG: nuclear transport factor 2 family protein [Acidobacteriia bacterium]|nr:nuclear transport factor 2 family protein [Terriglobia bacterium]